MRATSLIFAMLLLTSAAAFAHKDEPLNELIQRADAASVSQQPGLYTEVAERELQSADKLYGSGQVDTARTALDDLVTYSEKASDAANRTHHRIKDTEIAIRKMAAKLRDMKRSLSFEDQQPVQVAVDHLETLRTGLLSHMFSKGH